MIEMKFAFGEMFITASNETGMLVLEDLIGLYTGINGLFTGCTSLYNFLRK